MIGRQVWDRAARGVALGVVFTGVAVSSVWAQPVVVAAQAYVAGAGFSTVTPAQALRGVAEGSLSPAELGVLVLETREATSVWRSRWMIRVTRRQIGAETLDLTEVERFNMGPATRVAFLRAHGTAAASEVFGVGPHVAWRLVTKPDGPSRTVLLNAGRRDYPEFEAKDRDCGGTLCTSVREPLSTRAAWSAVREETARAAPSMYPAIVNRTDGRVDFEDESIAHVVRGLSVLGGLAPGAGATWLGPAAGTSMTLLVDSNVDEDGGSDAAVGPVAGGATWMRRVSAVAVSPELTVRVFEGVLRVRFGAGG